MIAGDPGTVERVTTRVDGGTLVVGMRKGEWETTHAPRVTIEVPVLHGFAESGAGTTTVSGLTGGDVELSISGAGTMTASGRAARLTVTLGGAAKIDTTALAARDVTVENDGVGVAKVRADGSLDATINGVGVVRYTGRVRDVQQHINGIGSIERI